jgi:hypothetical protein
MKAKAEGISESTVYRRQAKKRLMDAKHAHARVASAHVASLLNKGSGHRRDANGRIVYEDQPVLPISVFIPLIKKGYCHLECETVTPRGTGPPFDQ